MKDKSHKTLVTIGKFSKQIYIFLLNVYIKKGGKLIALRVNRAS